MEKFYRLTLLSTLLFFVLLLLFNSPNVIAQTTTGNIAGKILDSNGSPLSEVQITALNQSSGALRGTYSNDEGGFRITALTPGVYKVTVDRIGYASVVRDNIHIMVGSTAELDFSLTSKDIISKEVVVEGKTPLIDTKKSDVSLEIQPEQIQSLPLNSRNFLELATIAPGAKVSTGGRGPVTTGALNSRFINAYIDGVDFKNHDLGGVVGTSFGETTNIIPEDAIQEFQVVTSMYKAEYSGASNGVINAVTKSGGNQFQGSAFGLFRTKGLNSRGAFEKTQPDYNRQQMGLTFGGPIVRDQTHFFISYERDNINNFYSVSTGLPQLDGTFKSPMTENLGLVKLTHNLSENNQLDLSWLSVSTDNSPGNFGGIISYSDGFNLSFRLNSYLLNDRWVLGNNTVNEFKLHYERYRKLASPVSSDIAKAYPTIRLGWNPNQPQTEDQDSYELRDDISYFTQGSTGAHVFKAGITLSRERLASDAAFLSGGELIYAADSSTNPVEGLIGFGNPSTQTWNTNFSVYLQDDWSPIHNLTFNLGLRWDFSNNMIDNNYVLPASLANDTALTNHLPSDYIPNGNRNIELGDIAPRVGFSWDIFNDQTTVLHGGSGLFYDRVIWNFPSNEQNNGLYNIYTIVFNSNTPITYSKDTLASYVQSGKVKQPAFGITLLPNSMPTPYTVQSSIGITQQLSSSLVASLDYINIRGYNEYTTYNINYQNGIGKPRVLTQAYAGINLATSQGKSWYNGIDLSITRPYLGDWQMQVSYTLSWAFSTFDDPFSGYTLQSSILRAPSVQDERHRFVVSGMVNLPFDFQVSGIITFDSPRPITAIAGSDVNKDGSTADDFPASGRNSIYPNMAKIRNWDKDIDLRISHYFDIAGSTKLVLLIEAFNVFNWTNFSAFNSNMSSKTFGLPNTALNPRQIQMGLKVIM